MIAHSYEGDIINQKYDFIEEIIEEVLVNKNTKAASTDRTDRILTHRFGLTNLSWYYGIKIFTFTVET